jgi:hypothetical protein
MNEVSKLNASPSDSFSVRFVVSLLLIRIGASAVLLALRRLRFNFSR